MRGRKVLVLGVAYKKDIDDMRESPALDMIRLLEQRGAEVGYHDPLRARSSRRTGTDSRRCRSPPRPLEAADCVMIVTDHTALDYG